MIAKFFALNYHRLSEKTVTITLKNPQMFVRRKIMSSEDEVRTLWREADCVCFDIDSTVCTDEAIDELAKFLQLGDAVSELTKSAMTGEMTYKASLEKRLNLMQPSRQDITSFITEHPPRLTDGIKELVTALKSRHTAIYLISGGFHSIIETVAEELGIPKTNIRANKLLFYYNGQYAGYDTTQPTIDSGGKPIVIQQLKDQFGFKKLIHIGDGVTDMEACPPADGFIGFGGNQIRKKVKDDSKWFVTSFQDLIDELQRKVRKTAPS